MKRCHIVHGLSALICACALVSISAFPPRKSVSSFNGSNLDGWTSKEIAGWKTTDGILHFDGSFNMADANLWTIKKYRAYVLTFDYRVPGKHDGPRDIGVMLRENAALNFEEHLPNNQWNRAVITVRDSTPEIEVRGISPDVLNAITVEMELNGKPFSKTTFSGIPKEGPIALQPRSFHIEFANIQIKDVPEKSSPEAFVPPAGFVPLFNGRNLDGWKTSLELEKHWAVKNGFLKNSTMVPSEDAATLWTEKSYGNYTLLFDWRPVGKERPHDLISLNLYDGRHRLDLKGNSDGSWNRAEIEVKNWTVSWRIDNVRGWRETGTASSRFFFTSAGDGAIGFENPSFPVQFANIYIKELDQEESKADPSLPPEGFVPLGVNLDAWEIASPGAAWKVNHQILENHSGHSAIISTNKYRNYILLFDWRVPKDDPHSNAPYLYVDRGPRPTGVRERFRNAFFFPEATLPPNLVGKWNRSRLIVQEDRCTIQVNDRLVRTADNLAGGNRSGKFGIGRDGARLDVANIYIKELK